MRGMGGHYLRRLVISALARLESLKIGMVGWVKQGSESTSEYRHQISDCNRGTSAMFYLLENLDSSKIESRHSLIGLRC